MFGAPADVGFYKGVIYKTNEKKQAVCGHQGGLLWGVVWEERETGEAHQPHFSEVKLLLY